MQKISLKSDECWCLHGNIAMLELKHSEILHLKYPERKDAMWQIRQVRLWCLLHWTTWFKMANFSCLSEVFFSTDASFIYINLKNGSQHQEITSDFIFFRLVYCISRLKLVKCRFIDTILPVHELNQNMNLECLRLFPMTLWLSRTKNNNLYSNYPFLDCLTDKT